MGDTYYDLLGVSRTASTDEIEAAYRKKLKETHPDVSEEESAQAETRQLIDAKETLTDAEERRRYDRLGHDRYVAVEGATPGDDAGPATSPADRATSGSAAGTAGTGRTQSDRSGATSTGRSADGGAATGASWYDSSPSADDAGGQQRRSRGRGDSAPGQTAGGGDATWRAWNTEATYSVRRGTDGLAGWGLSSEGPRLLLIATLFVYPILLFGALFPMFPLVLRAVIGVCILLTVAYLQSQPGVGIVVFGVWSLLLPVVILVSGYTLFGLLSFLALLAVVLPFGLSVLTMVALRSVGI